MCEILIAAQEEGKYNRKQPKAKVHKLKRNNSHSPFAEEDFAPKKLKVGILAQLILASGQ